MKPNAYNTKEIKNRADAIRAKCLDCCCGQPGEVRLCPAKQCPLWKYRLKYRDPEVEE